MIKILCVVLLAGCASVPGWEPVMVRHIRASFETCRVESGNFDAVLVWVAPNGSFYQIQTQTGAATDRMRQCLSDVLGSKVIR